MSADEFIKILSRQKHEKFIRQLNLIDISFVLINQKSEKSAVSVVWACEIWEDMSNKSSNIEMINR